MAPCDSASDYPRSGRNSSHPPTASMPSCAAVFAEIKACHMALDSIRITENHYKLTRYKLTRMKLVVPVHFRAILKCAVRPVQWSTLLNFAPSSR